ncbi:unnamed protein product, partial [Ixodes persulcatus]
SRKTGRTCFYEAQEASTALTTLDHSSLDEAESQTTTTETRQSLSTMRVSTAYHRKNEDRSKSSNETTNEEISQTSDASTSVPEGDHSSKGRQSRGRRKWYPDFLQRHSGNIFTGVIAGSALLLLFPVCILYYTAGTLAARFPAPPNIGRDDPVHYANPACVDYQPLSSNGPNYAELSFVDDDFVPYKTKVKSRNAIFCVYQNDVFERFPKLQYRVTDVPGAYCTHLLYYKAGVTADGTIYSKDPTFDETYKGYRSAAELKNTYPHLMVLLALGGGPDARDTFQFSSFTSDVNRTRNFADKAYWWLVGKGLDGLHIDWRQPGGECGRRNDKQNFLRLVRALRERFGVRSLLTIAVPHNGEQRHRGYHLPGLADHANYLLAVTHSFHNTSARRTQCPSPYEAAPNYTGPTVREVVRTLKHEVPREHRERLCFSVSLKGLFWTLKTSSAFRVGSPAVRGGPPVGGSHTRGLVEYPLICKYLLKGSLDEVGLCNYAVRFRNWVSYEGTTSLRVKLDRMRQDMGTPGLCLAVWDMEFDDFLGTCGTSRSPLLRTIFLALAS